MHSFFSLIPLIIFFAQRGHAQVCYDEFDWSTITPSTDLRWTSCYTSVADVYQCARLEVPLDYYNVSGTNATAAIAMIRIPSPHGLNGSDVYRGPVLFNPGGPGESGVDTLLTDAAAVLQARIGDEYDLVGFDPRGVGRSTPQVQRIPSKVTAAIWGEGTFFGLLPPLSIPGNLGLTLSRAKVSNAVYGQTGAAYLPFMNTPYTAEDTMQIVNAHGREKLNYYGVSYGTVLGVTLATMFPDKIERMVLDGVANAEEYYAGNITANLLDTDKGVDVFFQACYDAGPEHCAFYAPSPAQISANLDALYENLKAEPVPALISDTSFGVVDYGMLRNLVRNFVYSPYTYFPLLAQGLSLLTQGNGTALFQLASTTTDFSCDCANATDPENSDDALVTFICNDAPLQNRTLAGWQALYNATANVSAYADVFAGIVMHCQSWPVVPENRVPSPSSIGGNTSVPILFIGNTVDPATPYAGAVAMSSLFPGSALLTQNSTGHISYSATSNCTTAIAAGYFADATLPEPGTVCQVEGDLFPALVAA